jgi:hypothetical protein
VTRSFEASATKSALRPVVDELRARSSMHVTEVVAALLRVCREHAAYIDQHRTEPAVHRPLLALEARLRARFEEWRRPRWTAARLGELAGELERACVEAPAPLVAWQAARWLERRSARHMVGFFFGVDRQVRGGDAWPIVESPAHCYDVPTGNPANRGRAADRGEWLTLVPDDTAGIDVRLRWCGAWLPHVKRGTRIAVGVLARTTDDFDFDRLEPDAAPRFYKVRPSAPDYRARIDAVITHALAAGAQVLVLPELSLTDELHAWFVTDPRVAKLPLVVAGSRHVAVTGEEPGRNVTTVLAYGRVLAEHDKMSDFFFQDGPVTRHEHVRPGTTMQVLLGERSSVLVLICKDALREDWQALVQRLAPRLLLIPAMTRESADFTAFADRLARSPQAITVVANIGGSCAIVGRPRRENTVIIGDVAIGTCYVYVVGGGQSGGDVG